MKIYKLILLFIIILNFGCSATYQFNKANNSYLRSEYKEAIHKYDEFLNEKENSPLQTQAELERSDCYYQLGYLEYEKKNWGLASKYLYLANSQIADTILDVCYLNLAESSLVKSDTLQAMQYYTYIIDYLPNSKIYNAVLVKRIELNIALRNYEAAFSDYVMLYDRDAQSNQRKEIQPKIDNSMPYLLQKAENLKSNGRYLDAVNELFQYTKYPLAQKNEILEEICSLYLVLADQQINKKAYKTAKDYFDKTLNTCSNKESIVEDKIIQVCTDLLAKGDSLQEELKFDEAIAKYNLCFVLKTDFAEATHKIEQAQADKAKYLKAVEFENIGDQYEQDENYQAALTSYRQAASYFVSNRIQNKIFRTRNLIEAEKDPKGFALRIIQNLDNGKIIRHLDTLKQNMKAKYGQYTQFSEWKVTYAIGGYKYEVRYDVISPEETFYFAWRVDLLKQHITPSNRVSDELLISGDIMKHQKQE